MDVRLRAARGISLLPDNGYSAKHVLPQRRSHMTGNVTLDGKYIPDLPVVFPGPLRLLIQGVNKLDADTDLVPHLPNAPFEHAADVQLPSNLGDGFIGSLISH